MIHLGSEGVGDGEGLKVRIRFYGHVALKTGREVELTFDRAPTLKEIVDLVNVRYGLSPPIQVSHASPVKLLVNGSEVEAEDRLRDGDEIRVMPFIAGG